MKKIFCFCVLISCIQYLHGQDSATKDKPFVVGRITEISSAILGEKRVLNIYLPAAYNENDTSRFPVIYLLDGSADEDFIHVAGLVQFLNFPWINSVPQSIIVGIANVDRRRDFTFPTTIAKDKKDFPTTGGSAKFIDFIEKELQPFIEKKFRTQNNRTLIGQSLGGLLATEILFKKPQLFNQYLIISPSLWWDNEQLLHQPIKPFIPKGNDSLSVYIAYGNEGAQMKNDAAELAGIVKKINPNAKILSEYFSNENHASIMHYAVYKGLVFLNGK